MKDELMHSHIRIINILLQSGYCAEYPSLRHRLILTLITLLLIYHSSGCWAMVSL